MDNHKGQSRFTRSNAMTLIAMVFERFLPLILPAIAVMALFMTALWFGLFKLLPLALHALVLGLFGILFVLALSQLRHFRWPSKEAVTARLENHNALEHAPIRAQTDAIATSNSPLEKALWQEHQKRMANRIGTLEGGRPNAGIAPKKRYIAFASLAGLAAIAFAFSKAPQGGQWSDILAEPPALALTQPRLDLWLTPPNYTGKAPIFVQAGAETGVISVPQGSLATLRVSRAENTPQDAIDAIKFSFSEGLETPSNIEQSKPNLYEWTLADSGILNVTTGEETLRSIAINVIDDEAPSIAWKDAIAVNRNGSFELKYQTEDDYGVREAWGSLAFVTPEENANPLYDMPEITLRARSGKGKQDGQSRIALGDHPLAGIEMALKLHVKDAADQEGETAQRIFILPQRTFTNPVALALVEQRGLIARNSLNTNRVQRLMEAMMVHPEVVIDNSSAFLGIRTAYQRIRSAESDDDLRGVVDYLWEIALDIEQGQLSDAEKRLKEARDNLREAIENGADEQELSQRIDELRQALNEYLQELVRQSQQNQQQQQAQNQQNQQQIEAQDLQDMLDQIEELAEQGAKEQAEQLLSQLEQMLDNLQAGQHQQEQGDNQQSQMQQRMNELGEIMREQQQLMDQTYQQQQPQQGQQGQEGQEGQGQEGQGEQQGGQQQSQSQQGQNGEGQPNQPSNQGQAMQRLQQGQQGLQQRLRDFTQSLESMGIDPGNEFGQAQSSMGEAGDSLGQGDAGSATGQQADALQALRDGAGQMMQQMQQAMEGERGGSNPQQAQQQRDRQGGSDPLGRAQPSNNPQFDSDTYVPDEIDMQRAREILNAIRKRLGDEAAPNNEKDYLERLLEFD